MRTVLFVFLALAAASVASCSRVQTGEPLNGCARRATHDVTWSNPSAADVVTTTADGPTCAQAVVTFVARNAGGDPLWAFSSTHTSMTIGDGAIQTDAVTEDAMDAFLANWAQVTQMGSGSLPAWRADAATLTESASTFSYTTPFDREVYESLRARNLPMICFAAGVESSQCLIIDPANGAPAAIVAYGP